MENISDGNRQPPMKPHMGALILSHHPLCRHFDEHVIEIRGRKYCKGCLLSYPTMIITLISGLFIPAFQNFTYFDFLILALITILISLGRLIPFRSNSLSIILRINFGLSLGFGLLSILLAPDIFYVVMIFFSFALIHGSIVFFKWKKFFEPCKECEYYPHFPACPGFDAKSN